MNVDPDLAFVTKREKVPSSMALLTPPVKKKLGLWLNIDIDLDRGPELIACVGLWRACRASIKREHQNKQTQNENQRFPNCAAPPACRFL